LKLEIRKIVLQLVTINAKERHYLMKEERRDYEKDIAQRAIIITLKVDLCERSECVVE